MCLFVGVYVSVPVYVCVHCVLVACLAITKYACCKMHLCLPGIVCVTPAARILHFNQSIPNLSSRSLFMCYLISLVVKVGGWIV